MRGCTDPASPRATLASRRSAGARGCPRSMSLACLERLGALQVVLAGVDHQMPAVASALELAAGEGQADLPVADAELPVGAHQRRRDLAVPADEEALCRAQPLAGAVQHVVA